MFITDVHDSLAFFLPELSFAVFDALFDFFELFFRRSVVLVIPLSGAVFPSTLTLVFPLSDLLFFVFDSLVEFTSTLFVESTYLLGTLRDVRICFGNEFLCCVLDPFFYGFESHVIRRKQRLCVDIGICSGGRLAEERVPV
ncbi:MULTISPECIES: hypothetical protein [Haloferax]|uniref:hypothetical protein n=1 Tax=Haloferax TaxID=2251 RepID=UPI0023DCCEC6|nr:MULTISPECIES: hypothetical protein [Haloferax]MDS0243561.1 hypothetical protein [Haloferax sp. S2CR25]MDS0446682.1 hypothetical protein [Haloferax sp. S2CR25-2]